MGAKFYKFSYYTLGTFFRVTWRIRAEGLNHVPKAGPAILASNHLSYADHYFLPSVLPRQVYFISKAQHFDVPVQRWLFKQWGVIPLRRGEGDNEAFAESIRVLEQGNLFGIYPEGTRSVDGKLHRGHTGVARLAILTGAPVVPVGMIGTDYILPKGKSVPRLGRCQIRIGKPLEFGHLKGQEGDRKTTRDATDRIMRAIQALSGQEYVDDYTRNPEIPRKPASPAP